MENESAFDPQVAHRHFSAVCFNQAWDLIDKPVRNSEEDRTMLTLGLASLWHWTQRTDCSPTSLSVGYWQVARIFALLGQPDLARQYGLDCLQVSLGEGIMPFYLAYAYEALARAESLAGNGPKMEAYLSLARQVTDTISDAEEKKQILSDLATIHQEK